MSSYVVLGGTSGLGLEIARHFANGGHRVTLTGRDGDRAAAAAKDVGGETTGLASTWPTRRHRLRTGRDRRRGRPGPGRDRA